jgi:hypothetical protein
MEEKIVLTQDELQIVKDIQNDGQFMTQEFGVIEIQLQNLELQKDELVESLKNLKVREVNFLTEIESKYGKGSINVETGEFVKL